MNHIKEIFVEKFLIATLFLFTLRMMPINGKEMYRVTVASRRFFSRLGTHHPLCIGGQAGSKASTNLLNR